MKLTGKKALIIGGNSGIGRDNVFMDVDGNNQIVQGDRS